MRTILWFIAFWVYQIRLIPLLRKAQALHLEGRRAERDAIVEAEVAKWARYLVSFIHADVRVAGTENIPANGPVVFVGNHQGNFDVPLMLGYVDKPKAFVSKKEVLKLPLVRSWMKLMGCLFIDRKDLRQSVRVMADAVNVLKDGQSLVIFPEGTRGKGGPMKPFKHGSFRMALQAEVPIVPVTIDGSFRLMEAQGIWMKPARVNITIHKPIPTAGLTKEEAAALPQLISDVVASALPEAQKPVKG